jgi:phosphatidylglycerophosphate synthase
MLTLKDLPTCRPCQAASRRQAVPVRLSPRTETGGIGTLSTSDLPTAADLVTLASYGLGLWWTVGGPTWAGLASIVGDELDGRLARATNTQSERGSALDWGADVSLTTMSLWRLGRETQHVTAALVSAPGILYVQALLRAKGYRPPIGSARAVVMVAAMVAHAVKR